MWQYVLKQPLWTPSKYLHWRLLENSSSMYLFTVDSLIESDRDGWRSRSIELPPTKTISGRNGDKTCGKTTGIIFRSTLESSNWFTDVFVLDMNTALFFIAVSQSSWAAQTFAFLNGWMWQQMEKNRWMIKRSVAWCNNMGGEKPLEAKHRFSWPDFPSEPLTAAFVHLSDGDTSTR